MCPTLQSQLHNTLEARRTREAYTDDLLRVSSTRSIATVPLLKTIVQAALFTP